MNFHARLRLIAAPNPRAETGHGFVEGLVVMTSIRTILPVARDRLLLIGDDRQLTEAAALLSKPDRHIVVVCNKAGEMVGVVTRTDVVRQIQHCQGCACTTACTMVMTTEVVSCQPDDLLQDVWSAMKVRGIQNVPIVDAQRKPMGLLSASDALQQLLSEVEYEDELLKDYVTCVGYR